MKIFVLITTLLISINCFAQNQYSNNSKTAFEYANKTIDLGILGGVVGAQDGYSYGAMGFNMTIYGVYADVLFWPKEHENDVRVQKWQDKSCIAGHFGYQIPITKAFRIIPVIGYAKVEEGETDGRDWTVGSNGIKNKFNAEKKVSGFDYGGVLVYSIGKCNLYASMTRRTIFGGIGLSMGH